MKKINILYYLLFGLVFVLPSCLRTEEDLFDESAALRINHAITEAKDVLVSADNGWIMQYFPTNDYAGVTFLVKFNKDDIANMAAKDASYKEATGTWNVIGDNGPVLTFDSYNEVFHVYSDPTDGPDGLGIGWGGDYEFIIQEVTNDLIKLKGKKRGTDITLQRLDENQNWETYFTILENMDKSLFNKNANIVWHLDINGKIYTLEGGASHIFTAKPVDAAIDEEEESTFEIPFIITTEGFRFAQVLAKEGDSIQTFKLNDDKKYLYAVEKPEVLITGATTPLSFFMDENAWTSGRSWAIDSNFLGGAFESAYADVVDGCKTAFKEDFDSFFFKYKLARKEKTLSFKSGTSKVYEGTYDFDITLKSEANSEVAFTNKGTMDKNGEIYRDRISGFQKILDLLSGGSFTLAADSPLCPATLKFTSVSDSKNWFTVTVANN
jgi:hypothetical protein